MKPVICLAAALLFYFHTLSQTAESVIDRVKKAQDNVHTLYYQLTRQDTLVTGMVRTLKGEVKLERLSADSIFGFRFRATREGFNSECIYDGNAAFYIDHDKKTVARAIYPEMIEAALSRPGGQLVAPDIVRLDTRDAVGFELKEDARYYYLKILLPDIDRYDVRERSKTIKIDKGRMLPLAIRHHQATLGKVQDLYYEVTSWKLNEPAWAYDFSSLRYPGHYQPEEQYENKALKALNGTNSPVFTIETLSGDKISAEQLKGKLVLLDFWELWCGPCLASLPKIDTLYQQYKERGLEILGIFHDTGSKETIRKLVKKLNLHFPNGAGNPGTKKAFAVNAVPQYILIDKQGKILFTSEGYSLQLEEMIQKHL